MTDTERTTKRARVLDVAARAGAERVVLTSPAAVSWYFGGARVTVPFGGDSVAAVAISASGDEVRCFSNEIERLCAEEGLDAAATPVDWYSPLVPLEWSADPHTIHESSLATELRRARAALLPVELDRYRSLGRDVARMVTGVAATLEPTTTEMDAAAHLAAGIVALGAEPVVLLVAGGERTAYRHPVPTRGALGARAILVVGARRHGLIVSLTRWVTFGPVSGGQRSVDARLLEVEASVFDATRPGRSVAEAFAALRGAYREHGFDENEWQRHHQGGPTGYVGRDPRASLTVTDPIVDGHAFAWNPSATAAKTEDTVVVSSRGVEVLTVDEAWPTVTVRGRGRPLALEK